MGNGSPRIGNSLPFGFGKVNSVAKKAALTNQAEMIIDIEKSRTVRKQLSHPVYFRLCFSKMRLHIGRRILAPQCTCRRELSGEELGAKRGVIA